MSTEEFTPSSDVPVQSQTTFDSPIINTPAEVNLDRSVTIWASGSVTADDANQTGYITVSKAEFHVHGRISSVDHQFLSLVL